MKLHNFHSSSASFRIRIALNLKGIDYAYVPVKLGWKDAEHDSETYRRFNPQQKVPVLVDGELSVAQTIAIIEYLEEVAPRPPLLPSSPAGRARVRSLSAFIACEIQPLNNLRVERYLAEQVGLEPGRLRDWRRHWIDLGFDALELELTRGSDTGRFCHGDTPTMADCFLVPQVLNSQRVTVGADLSRWPTIERIYRTALETRAFSDALPKNQPDFEDLRLH